MQKGTILAVDDDENLQIVVGHYFEDDGYKVVLANCAAKALEEASSRSFDVILLDLILPDGEGVTLIPQLRTKTSAPIIVVSGKSDTTEKIICLEMGADDYITKPFEMRELAARIKAVARRANDNPPTSQDKKNEESAVKLTFNGWCLDLAKYQLFDQKGASADLTTGEFKLLEALALSANRVLSREHLFDLTREQDYDSYDRAIDIQVARLRKKLKNDSELISTVRGVGYMLTADVKKA